MGNIIELQYAGNRQVPVYPNKFSNQISRPYVCYRHEGNHQERCRLVVIIIAAIFQVPLAQIMGATRATARVANARQAAIYIAHTLLSVSYGEVALFFGRDRTTIAHACKTIEDLRDDISFDCKLVMAENLVDDALIFYERTSDKPPSHPIEHGAVS